MKIIVNKLLPPKGYVAINLFGFLLCRDRKKVTRIVINHEKIHTAQMRELLYVFFYILYGIEFLLRLWLYLDWHAAYRNISFEREAYAKEKYFPYMSKRKHYAWINYIFR
jgi:hypothetical protein